MQQIQKIVFTTKEAYEKKVQDGTRDLNAVYAIDAEESASKKDIQKEFQNFGLSLGLDKEMIDFYQQDISLKGLLEEVIKSSVIFGTTSGDEVAYGSGTKILKVNGIQQEKICIKVFQNESDLGYVKFEHKNNPNFLKITLPDSLNLEEDYKVQVSDIFKQNTYTYNVVHSFKEKVNELVDKGIERFSQIHGDPYENQSWSRMELKTLDGFPVIKTNEDFVHSVSYYDSQTHQINFVNKDLTLTEENVDTMFNDVGDGIYRLFLNEDFTSYYDLTSNQWKAFEESDQEKLNKYKERYGSKIREILHPETHADETHTEESH